MDFAKWVRDNDFSLYTPHIEQMFLDQYTHPNFMENPTLNELYSDAHEDFEMGVRAGIKATWQEVFGNK